MKPGAKTRSPDPAAGDGQYVVVLKGSLIHEGVEKKGITVIHLDPRDGAFPIVAGPQGLQGLVLNFPLPTPQVKSVARPAAGAHDKLWQCELCAFSFDEAAGLPEEGIAPGTPWEQVPHDFICPDCSATKADFTPLDL
jgi:rubredoxin